MWLDDAVFQQGGYALSADFTITVGAVTAVLGPSGAGKSTLLGGIAGFVPQIQGRLMWEESDIATLPPAKRPVSMLFQDNNLFPHLTALQNVALAREPRLKPTAATNEAVEEMLQRVGLVGLSGRRPAELSGGQQSRVALARALLQDRPVMLMDEPFGALGPALKAEMLDLSVELAGEAARTLVVVTHEPLDAERIGDEVIGVSEGKAFAPVAASDFLHNPPPVFADYMNLK